MNEFVEQWLRFDRLMNAVKDRRTFPQYTPELALAMTEEPRRLASNLIWQNGNFMDFFSADYAYLSSSLAALYKVEAPKTRVRKGRPAARDREGRRARAGRLSGSHEQTDRYISHGARPVCARAVPLPGGPAAAPGVSTNLPNLTKEKPQTNRERLAIHLNNESCSSCHSLIDPIGFGFEKFDAIGQHREKLKLTFTGDARTRKQKPSRVELP